MITDVIVLSSMALAFVFVVAWLLRPSLRTWIERPKYGFQERLRRYDQLQGENTDPEGAHPRE